MLEHQAVVRQQRGLLGGNVNFAIWIQAVHTAHGYIGQPFQPLCPQAVYGGLFQFGVENIDQSFHGSVLSAAVKDLVIIDLAWQIGSLKMVFPVFRLPFA
ncbi:hypothetical protein GCWU000324_01187 [Kingella oralis ATCC 51147]|uniref:Uncharacterized protein n=1 Tax=Kingella oralis ATCC 51147 TaxID=629741 RepID=C4GGB9_9NEIS|nr:hypothetical protein GCWU000324_01187 [Kingella oralis ATCC 51147]